MKRQRAGRRAIGWRWAAALVVLPALALAVPVALGQSGAGYTLEWSTIDSGGGASSGGSFALSGTLGQPDAGVLAGGNYTLSGGFWGGVDGGVSGPAHVYLPLAVR